MNSPSHVRFEILRELGSGGGGQVYLAHDKMLHRQVALKRLRADTGKELDRNRLIREAQRASRLSHANIAVIYDVVEEPNDLFIVMEYAPDGTLRNRLEKPLSVDEFYDIALQWLEAVKAAHERGVVHADLKPENVLLIKNTVKICDFGISRLLHNTNDSTVTSVASTEPAFAGTPAYMAPERLLSGQIDKQSDIFSLGVMFYEILGGRRPFTGNNVAEICSSVLQTEPLQLHIVNPAVPQNVSRTVHRMLAKSPADRFASIEEVLDALHATANANSRMLRARSSRRNWILAGLVAALLLVTLAGYFGIVTVSSLRTKSIPSRVSMVVMPFRSLGASPEQRLVADGLIDTVTAQLNGLNLQQPLQVWPAAEVRNRKVATFEDARKEFSANLVLTGDIQWAGEMARVNYVLVDTSTQQQVRAGTVTESTKDLFQLQDRVVRAVLTTLEIELQPNETAAIDQNRTPRAGAQELYLQGRGYLLNYDRPENIDAAITVLQRSLREDPNYGRAYAALGDAYWRKFETTKSTEWVDLSRSSCERAAGLSSRLPEAQGCLGTIALNTGKYEQAVGFLQKALDGAPVEDSYYGNLALAFERLHQSSQAEDVLKRMIRVRPQYWAGYNNLGALYARTGRPGEAVEMFKQVVSLAPDSFRGYANLGAAYYRLDRYPEAISAFNDSMKIRPNYQAASNLGTIFFFSGSYGKAADAFQAAVRFRDRDYRLWANLASAEKWAGRVTEAKAAFLRSTELAEESRRINPQDASLLGLLADNYASLGDLDKTAMLIRQALMMSPDDPSLLFRAGVIYEYFFHDRAQAFSLLTRALARGYEPAEIERAPALAELRKDQKYKSLFKQ